MPDNALVKFSFVLYARGSAGLHVPGRTPSADLPVGSGVLPLILWNAHHECWTAWVTLERLKKTNLKAVNGGLHRKHPPSRTLHRTCRAGPRAANRACTSTTDTNI